MYKFKVDFILVFDNDGEECRFCDVVYANSPEAAVKNRRRAYSDPAVEFTLVSVILA